MWTLAYWDFPVPTGTVNRPCGGTDPVTRFRYDVPSTVEMGFLPRPGPGPYPFCGRTGETLAMNKFRKLSSVLGDPSPLSGTVVPDPQDRSGSGGSHGTRGEGGCGRWGVFHPSFTHDSRRPFGTEVHEPRAGSDTPLSSRRDGTLPGYVHWRCRVFRPGRREHALS